MDKDKKTAKFPNPDVLEGIPVHHPHEEYARMDAHFKKNRGAKD